MPVEFFIFRRDWDFETTIDRAGFDTLDPRRSASIILGGSPQQK